MHHKQVYQCRTSPCWQVIAEADSLDTLFDVLPYHQNLPQPHSVR